MYMEGTVWSHTVQCHLDIDVRGDLQTLHFKECA